MRIKVELNFPAHLKDKPLICQVCKKFDITLSILEASFSTDVGWAILILEGERGPLEETLGYLEGRGVEIAKREEVT